MYNDSLTGLYTIQENKIPVATNIIEISSKGGYKSNGWNFEGAPPTNDIQLLRGMISQMSKLALKRNPYLNRIVIDFIKEGNKSGFYLYHLLQIKCADFDGTYATADQTIEKSS